MPIVSVIVPVYNTMQWLAECVESIREQTLQDIEIILIDDGSTDYSGAICDAYKDIDNRIQVIHQKNNGVSAARNLGIDIAIGKYIMFCDSDDYVAPGWCEELIELSEKNPDAWVCAGFFIIDSHGCREVLYERENAYSIIKKGNYLQLYKSGLVDDVWNKIFRKEIIIKHNIRFQETLDFGEDTLFVTDYWKKIQYGIVRNIDSLYYYRCWSMETLSNSAAGIRRFNDLTKKIAALKYFMCENEILEFLKVIFWKYSRYSLWHILNFDKYKSISDIIKNFRKVVESSEFQEWYQAAEDKLNDPWIEILRNKDYHSIYEFLSEYYMPYDKENRGLNFETER